MGKIIQILNKLRIKSICMILLGIILFQVTCPVIEGIPWSELFINKVQAANHICAECGLFITGDVAYCEYPKCKNSKDSVNNQFHPGCMQKHNNKYKEWHYCYECGKKYGNGSKLTTCIYCGHIRHKGCHEKHICSSANFSQICSSCGRASAGKICVEEGCGKFICTQCSSDHFHGDNLNFCEKHPVRIKTQTCDSCGTSFCEICYNEHLASHNQSTSVNKNNNSSGNNQGGNTGGGSGGSSTTKRKTPEAGTKIQFPNDSTYSAFANAIQNAGYNVTRHDSNRSLTVPTDTLQAITVMSFENVTEFYPSEI